MMGTHPAARHRRMGKTHHTEGRPASVAPRTTFHTLPIADVRRETEDAISLAFAIPGALRPAFAFQPGQYLTLRAQIGAEDTRRSYSICSGLDDPALRIAIKRVPDGRFSTWAHDALQPGHTLDVMPPAGRFTVPLGIPRSYLAVAAGSGITPILSLTKSILARDPGSRVTLLYGSRSTAQILFRDALEDLKSQHMGRLSLHHVLSREQTDIPILHGRLDGARVLALTRGEHPDLALLCGPGALIGSVTAALTNAGMDPATILSERFAPDGEPAPRPPRPEPRPGAAPYAIAVIVSDGVRTEVPVLEGEPILDAALRAGLDLPHSCRAGMCSTCRARITEGSVRMDVNYGLEPWETEAGYVLTCQAHPAPGRVVADYDQV